MAVPQPALEGVMMVGCCSKPLPLLDLQKNLLPVWNSVDVGH
jgi:hypothetical protein